jgi:hypothetical protein
MFIADPGSFSGFFHTGSAPDPRSWILIQNTALHRENLKRTTLRTVSEIFSLKGFVAISWQNHDKIMATGKSKTNYFHSWG